MATQTRWFCAACQREWVYAHEWTADDGCPACESPAIAQRTFTAAFPGGDLPREIQPRSEPPLPLRRASQEDA